MLSLAQLSSSLFNELICVSSPDRSVTPHRWLPRYPASFSEHIHGYLFAVGFPAEFPNFWPDFFLFFFLRFLFTGRVGKNPSQVLSWNKLYLIPSGNLFNSFRNLAKAHISKAISKVFVARMNLNFLYLTSSIPSKLNSLSSGSDDTSLLSNPLFWKLDLNTAAQSIKQSSFLSRDSGNQNVEFLGQGWRLFCLPLEIFSHLIFSFWGKHFSRHFRSFGTAGAVVKNITGWIILHFLPVFSSLCWEMRDQGKSYLWYSFLTQSHFHRQLLSVLLKLALTISPSSPSSPQSSQSWRTSLFGKKILTIAPSMKHYNSSSVYYLQKLFKLKRSYCGQSNNEI